MAALNAGHIHKPSRATNQSAAGEGQFGHGLKATFGYGSCAISHAAATFENISNQRVMLEALEFHIGKQMRIGVIEMNHEANRHQIIFEVIHKRTATCLSAQRPTHGVRDLALAVVFGLHFPKLFHAQTKFLWFAAFGEIVFGNNFFGQ